MIPIQAILFDPDGTLVDSTEDIALAVRYVQGQFGYPLSQEEEIVSFIGDGAMHLLRRALPGAPAARLEQALGPFLAYYRQHCLDHTVAYPQVEETLAYFRAKKMAVVTNKPADVSRDILEGLKLAPYFQRVLGGDSVVQKKPHPEPVLESLKALGIRRAKDVVMVGDGPQDILAGREAGVQTCGIFSNLSDPEKLKQSKPDFTILKMNELMRIFS